MPTHKTTTHIWSLYKTLQNRLVEGCCWEGMGTLKVPFSRSGKFGRIASLWKFGNLVLIVNKQLLFGVRTKHSKTDSWRNVAGFLESGTVCEQTEHWGAFFQIWKVGENCLFGHCLWKSGNLMVIVNRWLLFGIHMKHCRTDQWRNVAGFTGSLEFGKVWEHWGAFFQMWKVGENCLLGQLRGSSQ